MKIKTYQIPLVIIAAGILFSLYLQLKIPQDTYFSGDAGLKALLAQQLSAGELRFDLAPPSETWVQKLWNDGLYPYQPPFAYKVAERYYITFPFTFPLVTAPFHTLFGFRGLYLIPLVSTWVIWGVFYLACRRAKFSSFSTSIALVILIFASHLTLYSAMYWEHSLATALCFAGMAILLIPGLFTSGDSPGLSKRNAAISGCFIGLAAWFRPEFLSMIATLAILVYFAWLAKNNQSQLLHKFDLKPIYFLAKNKEIFVTSMLMTVGLFFLANQLIYGRFLGMNAVEVVEGFSLTQRLAEAWYNFKQLTVVFFEYFPIAFFPVLYLFLYGFRRLESRFNLKIVTIGLAVTLIAAAGYLLLTGGTSELKVAIKQFSLPLLIMIAWLYLFRKTEIEYNAKMTIVYIICLLFTVGACVLLDSGADEIAVGGKQWGPRYLLSLLPIVSLLVVEQFNYIKEASRRPPLRYATIALFSGLLIIGIHKNVYLGTNFLSKTHQSMPVVLQALRENPNKVIAASHQYVIQLLEPAFRTEKLFFRAEDSKSLVKLGSVLTEQGQDKFIYVCYPFRKCNPPQDPKSNLQFNKGDRKFQIDLLSRGKVGRYPIYEASITQES